MVFEDGTHYEGEFKSAGIFCGKGTLTFRSGDRLEGNINGGWNDGVKVNAVLHIIKAGTGNSENSAKPVSFGKLCVPPDQKWRAIFRQCYAHLGISEPNAKSLFSNSDKTAETQRIWQNVAVIINKSHQKMLESRERPPTNSIVKDKDKSKEFLNKIPSYGQDKLSLASYSELHEYLMKAFDSAEHPLGSLLVEIATVYTATYGGVRVHPLLLSHAVAELRSITSRIYDLVTRFFPALPRGGKECVLGTEEEGNWFVFFSHFIKLIRGDTFIFSYVIDHVHRLANFINFISFILFIYLFNFISYARTFPTKSFNRSEFRYLATQQ